jgi:hypothetical protein
MKVFQFEEVGTIDPIVLTYSYYLSGNGTYDYWLGARENEQTLHYR